MLVYQRLPQQVITTAKEGNSSMGERCAIAMLAYWWVPLGNSQTPQKKNKTGIPILPLFLGGD